MPDLVMSALFLFFPRYTCFADTYIAGGRERANNRKTNSGVTLDKHTSRFN